MLILFYIYIVFPSLFYLCLIRMPYPYCYVLFFWYYSNFYSNCLLPLHCRWGPSLISLYMLWVCLMTIKLNWIESSWTEFKLIRWTFLILASASGNRCASSKSFWMKRRSEQRWSISQPSLPHLFVRVEHVHLLVEGLRHLLLQLLDLHRPLEREDAGGGSGCKVQRSISQLFLTLTSIAIIERVHYVIVVIYKQFQETNGDELFTATYWIFWTHWNETEFTDVGEINPVVRSSRCFVFDTSAVN